MKALFSSLLFALFLLPVKPAESAEPACYRTARVPAHEFAFIQPDLLDRVTGLTWNGAACVEVSFWRGNPVVEQKLYAPYRQVYEAYARAVERGDREAARRIYTWLRPAPLNFPDWAALFESATTAPLPWGMPMAVRIMRLLTPSTVLDRIIYVSRDPQAPVLSMDKAWPLLFLYMGGEVYPKDEWVEVRGKNYRVSDFLNWRYPNYVLENGESQGKPGKMRLR